MLDKIIKVTGRAVCVPGDDIDTDQIIPARFMKCVTFGGLGEYFFYDARKDEDGRLKEHPLNDPRYEGAVILISGRNFGCGSSREHAPQALHRAGFRAVAAESFAEIFFGNATQLGVPCVSLAPADLEKVRQAVGADPRTPVSMDLRQMRLAYGEKSVPFAMPDAARKSLIRGAWDPLEDLLKGAEKAEKKASKLPCVKPA